MAASVVVMEMKHERSMPCNTPKACSHLSPVAQAAITPLAVAAMWLRRVRDCLEGIGKPHAGAKRVHSLRVATRRAGVAIELIRVALKHKRCDALRKRLVDLRKSADPVRNLDVVIGHLAFARKGTSRHKWLMAARHDRKIAIHRLQKHAKKEMKYWQLSMVSPPQLRKITGDPDMKTSFFDGVVRMVTRVRKRWTSRRSGGWDWHRLRVAAKKARYCLEQCRAMDPDWEPGKLTEILEKIQNQLGKLNDHKLMAIDLDARIKAGGHGGWTGLLLSERAFVKNHKMAIHNWLANDFFRFRRVAKRFLKHLDSAWMKSGKP